MIRGHVRLVLAPRLDISQCDRITDHHKTPSFLHDFAWGWTGKCVCYVCPPASGVAGAPSSCSGSAPSPPLLDADSTADASTSAAGVALLLGEHVSGLSAGAHSGRLQCAGLTIVGLVGSVGLQRNKWEMSGE